MTAVEVHHVETGPSDAPMVVLHDALGSSLDMWEDRAATVRAEGVGAVADAVVDRWLTPGRAAADPALVERLLTMVNGTSAEGYAGCCEAIGTMDLRDDLAAVTTPTLLLVVGDEDPAMPRAHAEVIADRLTGARIVVVGPAAHLANVEQPDAITGHILAHLDAEGPR